MANSEELNVLSICVELLESIDAAAAKRISDYLASKFMTASEMPASSAARKVGSQKKQGKRGRPAKAAKTAITAVSEAASLKTGKKKRGRPAKKRRGRPAKATIMPASTVIASTLPATEEKKKRGRPASSTKSTGKKRGRPVSTTKSTGKRRGRPAKALNPGTEKVQLVVKSVSKKRGRPASSTKKTTSGKKRGRPAKKSIGDRIIRTDGTYPLAIQK